MGVDVEELVDGDLGVEGGGVEFGVAEELLNEADVGSVFEHMGGAGVAEKAPRGTAWLMSAPRTLVPLAPPPHASLPACAGVRRSRCNGARVAVEQSRSLARTAPRRGRNVVYSV